MQTETHGNRNGMDDLYILPDNEREASAIVAYLESNQIRHYWELSDTAGQNWYGERFLDIPFGEGHLDAIRCAVAENY